ncbi:hypothetical protein P4U99_13365 [Brevibacillus agri]|nr:MULTISPECIES: hypothetical protein [Brevibacillus]MDN4093205.1 hypothetical protein [Brevibacillus agri]MDR9506772.1 hypothetical protein [Brevibacillus agri]MED1644160.1 hypothetical protein [Brevibacillus agri]MED1653021.1 hypothetical protein [Brevibacillus agri]MED1686589.1 hypothetical protein [Brevibacillus agri]
MRQTAWRRPQFAAKIERDDNPFVNRQLQPLAAVVDAPPQHAAA